jgi:serine/threonine-protein kinase HipA
LPLAQEDFCQLSNRSPDTAGANYKYDSSYEETGQILRRFSPSYRIDVEKLFRVIVFNYVIGNGDAHLKNFSLLETPFGDFSLAPAYDLLSTSMHLLDETRTALDLFDSNFETESHRRNAFYKRADFIELALRFGVTEERALRDLGIFDEQRETVTAMINGSMLHEKAKQAYLALYADRSRAIRT